MKKTASNAIATVIMAVIFSSIMIGSHLSKIERADGIVVTKTGESWGFYVEVKSDLLPKGGATVLISKDKFGAISEGDVVCIGHTSFWKWLDHTGRCQ
jgi:hypothetical protein